MIKLVLLALLAAAPLGVAGAGAQNATARPPAPSLVPPSAPVKPTGSDGFLPRWLVLEPIRVPGQLTDRAVQTAVTTASVPNQLTALPRAGETLTVGETSLKWHAVDTLAYNVNLFHFAYGLKQPTSNVLFWVLTVVNAPRDLTDVRFAIGSNAASVWWVNGQEVIGIYNDRQSVIDDGVSKRLALKKGPNLIRGAIVNAGGATDFCARFLDEEGRPVKGLTVSLVNH